ncbi:hypothetical protein FACS189485_05600 [Spirochaetia bacterium]|nr:hypothetical protein FACS189485_05600 [Spirochaetia bacterium]
MYTKVSWLMGLTFSVRLPGLRPVAVLDGIVPNHSYGIAEDFRPMPGASLPLKYTF